MALNLSVSPASLPWSTKYPIASTDSSGRFSVSSKNAITGGSLSLRLSSTMRGGSTGGKACTVRSSLDTVGPTVTVGQVTEVNKDTFWPIVKAAGNKAVVLDMYTQCDGEFSAGYNLDFRQGLYFKPSTMTCGPCKVMAPKYQELSEKYLDVVFLKLDCNQENKPLAKELGIRVVPTFKILKDEKIVKEVTGAKFDDLVLAIDTVRSS